MTDLTRYLTLESLLLLVGRLDVGPVVDPGLLDSAAARPAASVLGADAYPDLSSKAAALLHSIAGNHPLTDGNKRLAWLATVVFLDLDGCQPGLPDDEAFDLVMEVAATDVGVPAIAARLDVRPR